MSAKNPNAMMAGNYTLIDEYAGQFVVDELLTLGVKRGFDPRWESDKPYFDAAEVRSHWTDTDDKPEDYFEVVFDLADEVLEYFNRELIPAGSFADWHEGSVIVWRICDADDETQCTEEDGECWHSLAF